MGNDAMRSLVILDSIAGVGTVVIVHYSGCGLMHITDETIKKPMNRKVPLFASRVGTMRLGEIRE